MNLDSFFSAISDAIVHTTIWEWIAIITALIYVVLAARESSWCWSFGIVSAGIYVWINYSIKLYLDTWLSVYYCVIGIYGWYVWIKKIPAKNETRSLRKITVKEIVVSCIIGIAATLILGWMSHRYTDSPLPYYDAALTSFSLVATFLTTQKILENWLAWVVIDAAYVIIYWQRALPFT